MVFNFFILICYVSEPSLGLFFWGAIVAYSPYVCWFFLTLCFALMGVAGSGWQSLLSLSDPGSSYVGGWFLWTITSNVSRSIAVITDDFPRSSVLSLVRPIGQMVDGLIPLITSWEVIVHFCYSCLDTSQRCIHCIWISRWSKCIWCVSPCWSWKCLLLEWFGFVGLEQI